MKTPGNLLRFRKGIWPGRPRYPRKKISKLLSLWLTTRIKQYLTNIRERVKLNNTFSPWETILVGVIQSSLLGPILFLIFIAEINDKLPNNANLSKYADDLLAYRVSNIIDNQVTQDKVTTVNEWGRKNKMRLNLGKNKHMIVNHRTGSNTTELTLNGINVDQSISTITLYYDALSQCVVV